MADILRLRAAAQQLPEEDARHLRELILEYKRQKVAMATIGQCIDRLAAVCRRGVFGYLVFIVADEIQKIREAL